LDIGIILVIVAVAALTALIVWQSLQANRERALGRMQNEQMARAAESLSQAQAALAGRLGQLGETQAAVQAQMAERLQAQEKAIAKTIEDRLLEMAKRVSDGLDVSAQKQATSLHELRERLVVIDSAQRNITELSAQVVSLQDILSNKQARGAFGEIQLNDLVVNVLPPSAYEFQATLGNGKRADCLLKLPNPPGSIVIDAKFPLESWRALRAAQDDAAKALAVRAFSAAILTHIRDIADKYIVPGETAESALMFIPSEAVYAELHANFGDVVEKSFRAKVWIVSPTTLMATLNTVRAVLKDARMREQASVIQKEVRLLLDDVRRLDDRVGAIGKHFHQAGEDLRHIQISTEKVAKRAERIEDLQLGSDSPADQLAPAVPPPSPRLVKDEQGSLV
jgi:DNA recombination protein RmuC